MDTHNEAFIRMINHTSDDFLLDKLSEAILNYRARKTKSNREEINQYIQMVLVKDEIGRIGVEKLVSDLKVHNTINKAIKQKDKN